MRTEELVESMHRTMGAEPVDIERITRQGRRLLVRRRATACGVVAVVVAAVAVPIGLLSRTDDSRPAQPAVGIEARFSTATPVGGVADTHSKFYWGSDPHAASLGPEAIWVEAADAPYRISFGFRDEGSGELRWAGEVAVPSGVGTGIDLPAIPHQHGEPTYVGMYRVPAGADADRYSVAVEGDKQRGAVDVEQSSAVLPGYLVFWVTASEELGRSIYAVENARGDRLVSGGFRTPVD